MTKILRGSIAILSAIGVIACSGVGNAEVPITEANGSVTTTGSMSTARAAHTATLLPNGKVLITGGMESETICLATAELYDPATDKFIKTGDMTAKRIGHQAVLLRTGKVLLYGGTNREDGTLRSAELYDSATGTFTATGSMKEKGGGLATLLADGRVLVAGGYNGQFLTSAEIYDPATESFTFTGKLNQPTPNTATLLKNGKVLLTGGGTHSLSAEVFANAELYDPSTGTFTPTGKMIRARNKYAATRLLDGRVLITGGTDERGWNGQLTQAEIYDPVKNAFVATGNMNSPRFKHLATVVVMPNGKVLIAGGARSVEVYDPVTGTFGTTAGGLDEARYFATATLLKNGQVLITGGYRRGIVSTASAWKYQPFLNRG